MRIPLIDLVAQYRAIQPEVEAAIRQVLESGQFILGPNVAALEQEVAAYLGVEHAVGVGSGTDALVLALRALKIGPGDEVIVPAYSFFATVEAVVLVGATPVFVDIQADTYCIDPQQVAERINARTKAVIPVHLYGHPADVLTLLELTRSHGVKIIEDNAQAFGAEYAGHKAGSLGDVACLSFFPSKNLGAYGDGGMVVTNHRAVAEQVRVLRTHGWRRKYYPEITGYNSRLDELQAAVLRVKLRHVDRWNDQRRDLARRYTHVLSGLSVRLPYEASWARHVYHLYVIRAQDRDEMQRALQEDGVATAVYYPQPLHLTEACRSLGYPHGSFPVAERASQETLALPIYPEMQASQIEGVVRAVQNASQKSVATTRSG